MEIFLSVVLWILIGSLNAYVAVRRGRDPMIWFVLGIFLGLLALVLLFLLPSLVSQDKEVEGGKQPNDSEISENAMGHMQTEEVREGGLNDGLLFGQSFDYGTKQWYYLDIERHQQGPVGLQMLKTKWADSQIQELTYVWCEGMDNWKKIVDLPGLKDVLS